MLLMSNSLKVVNIALVFCASFNLLAIFIRMRFIFTLCSDLVPAISLVGSAGGNLHHHLSQLLQWQVDLH